MIIASFDIGSKHLGCVVVNGKKIVQWKTISLRKQCDICGEREATYILNEKYTCRMCGKSKKKINYKNLDLLYININIELNKIKNIEKVILENQYFNMHMKTIQTMIFYYFKNIGVPVLIKNPLTTKQLQRFEYSPQITNRKKITIDITRRLITKKDEKKYLQGKKIDDLTDAFVLLYYYTYKSKTV
jgi:hypothetical protein